MWIYMKHLYALRMKDYTKNSWDSRSYLRKHTWKNSGLNLMGLSFIIKAMHEASHFSNEVQGNLEMGFSSCFRRETFTY